MQRAALDAVRTGLTRVDELLAGRRRRVAQSAQAALIAVDPRTGEILAMVGGRSYNTSQFNRAVAARRQPGSVFKPFVYLARSKGRRGGPRRSDAGVADRRRARRHSPSTIRSGNRRTTKPTMESHLASGLAMSRNLGTIRVVSRSSSRRSPRSGAASARHPPKGYPSITLGVFELTPLEVAQAYTLFINDGGFRALRAIDRITAGARSLKPSEVKVKAFARPRDDVPCDEHDSYVITKAPRQRARGAGFTLDAAGKSGTTNDLRDAWFVGFTPELLTVVWVGFDDNQPVGLSGTQAALPIWTEFMKTALAGHANRTFEPPDGIVFAEIDRDTGRLATPACPRTMSESFLAGTEPGEICPLHRW